MPSETRGDDHRTCGHCGAAVGDGRFCGRCGTELPAALPVTDTAPPPAAPPVRAVMPTAPAASTASPLLPAQPTPTPPSSKRRVVAAVVAAAAVLISLAVVFTRGGDDDGTPATTDAPETSVSTTSEPAPETTPPAPTTATAPSTTVAPDTTIAPATTALPTTAAPTTVAPTVAPTVPPVDPGARYVGLVFDPLDPPPGVTEIDGAVIGPGGYVVSWMTGPEGDMFWLQQVTLQTDRIEEVRVTDVVMFPPLEQDVGDVVVMGTSACELDGAPVEWAVGIFPYSGQQWMTDPYAVWWVDEINGTFVELPATTRCIDQGFGA